MCISYSLYKFTTFRAVNVSSFEAVRAEMDKNIEGDEYLDHLDKTLERQRNLRVVTP